MLKVALMDILLIGVGLCVFALFHHVLPEEYEDAGVVLARPSAAPVEQQALAAERTPAPGGEAEAGQTQEPAETGAAAQDWGVKFADKFTGGEVISRENFYQSRDIRVEVTPVLKENLAYYVADIYIRNIENLRTALARDKYGKSLHQTVMTMSKNKGAIVAISGDYYGVRGKGVVVRNGVMYRDTKFKDTCVLYYDGTMKTYTKEELDVEAVLAQGPYQVWSFGPKLLENGQAMDSFNSEVTPANPRCAIGYYEPGHYCFVVVDGRQKGYSTGMTMKRLSRLFYELGCQEAYNLDGGQTAVMAWGDQMVNRAVGGGRPVSDMVYIGEVTGDAQ